MKNVLTAFCLLLSAIASSQGSTEPAFRQGSKLLYQVSTSDGNVPLTVILDSVSSGYVKLGWILNSTDKGSWIMKKNSLESATKGWWDEPQPGTEVVMPDDQSVALFSKAQWNAIQKEKKVVYDMVTYVVKSPTQQGLKIGEKEMNTVFLEGADGAKIWVLNSPALPLILRIDGNKAGPNVFLQSINEAEK